MLFDQKNNTASWVGADLELITDADAEKITTEEEERKIIHQQMKKYNRYFHRYYKRGEKWVGSIFLGEGLGIFVGMPMLAQTTLVATSAIMPMALGIFIVGAVTMVVAATNNLNLGTSSKYSKALQSQDGWNWSARSRKVSQEIFYQYVNYAQKGYPVRKRFWEK